jgi:hypothetical protein
VNILNHAIVVVGEEGSADNIPVPRYVGACANIHEKLLHIWNYNENHDCQDDTLCSELQQTPNAALKFTQYTIQIHTFVKTISCA